MNVNSSGRNLLKTLFLTASLTVSFSAIPIAAAEADATTNTPAEIKLDAVANSVVKVFSTLRYPDVYKPWTKDSPSDATGTGVVIEGKRILTCAHVVLYAS